MNILGWVLLAVGLIGLWLSYSSGYGAVGYVVSVIIGAVGVWLGMRKEDSSVM